MNTAAIENWTVDMNNWELTHVDFCETAEYFETSVFAQKKKNLWFETRLS